MTDIHHQGLILAVHEWVKQARRDTGTGDGGLTSDERRELAELRRENRRLKVPVLPTMHGHSGALLSLARPS